MENMKCLPDTELEVMKVIWQEEAVLSTPEIKERLEENRPWSVSALQTILNRLIEKGFLGSHKEGKKRYYAPLIQEAEYMVCENKHFFERTGNRSLTKLVASLFDSHSVTEQDLDELEEYIRRKTGGA